MDDDFLHKISIDAIVNDTGLTVDEVAKLSGIKEARNLGKWKQSKPNGSRPNYNALVHLLRHGATVETLFGVDYKKIHQEFVVPPSTQDILNSPEFHKRVMELIQEWRSKGMV